MFPGKVLQFGVRERGKFGAGRLENVNWSNRYQAERLVRLAKIVVKPFWPGFAMSLSTD
jgi:hypothetical protein